jgi:hypothetical protein
LEETWLRAPVQATVTELRLMLRVPASRWALPKEPDIDFTGMRPEHPVVELAGAVTGDDGFLRLAGRLREYAEGATRPEDQGDSNPGVGFNAQCPPTGRRVRSDASFPDRARGEGT